MQPTPMPSKTSFFAATTVLAKRLSPAIRRAAAAALILTAAAALSWPAPAAAQECADGAFGEGGTFTVRNADDKAVTGMTLAFQCGEILGDGRLVPTGYRMQLTGECNGGDCSYPLVILSPTARPENYSAFFVEGDANVTVHVRPARREGTLRVSVATRVPGRRRANAALADDTDADDADTAEASDAAAASDQPRARRRANRPKVYRMRRARN